MPDRIQRKRVPSTLLAGILWLLLLATSGSEEAAWTLRRQEIDSIPYLSLSDLAEAVGGGLHTHTLKGKVEWKLGQHRIIFTPLSAYLVVDDQSYRFPYSVKADNEGFWVPEAETTHLFRRLFLPRYLRLLEEAVSRIPERLEGSDSLFERTRRTVKIRSELWAIDTVIIDPGHGGRDTGAAGSTGAKEKDITLAVGRRLQDLLGKGGIRAVLTRSADDFVPLGRRARIARKNGGKLFISLHCNASQRAEANGTEIYFLSAAKTEEAAEVAKRENAVVRFEEARDEKAETERERELMDIQIGLLSSQFLQESQELAATVRSEISRKLGNLQDRGVKQADFYVMKGTMASMPSILVEMGFLTNRSDEKKLKSASFQKKMAGIICQAVLNFKQRYESQLKNPQ